MSWIDLSVVQNTHENFKFFEGAQQCKSFLELLDVMKQDSIVLKSFVEHSANLEKAKNRMTFYDLLALFELIHERGLDLYVAKNEELQKMFTTLRIFEIIDYKKSELFSALSKKEWVDELTQDKTLLQKELQDEESEDSNAFNFFQNTPITDERCGSIDKAYEVHQKIEKENHQNLREIRSHIDEIQIRKVDEEQSSRNVFTEFFEKDLHSDASFEDLYRGQKIEILKRLKKHLKAIVPFESIKQQNKESMMTTRALSQFLNKLVQCDLSAQKDLFMLKTELKGLLKDEVEKFLYQNSIFDDVVEQLNASKLIDKCERQLKNIKLVKEFKYEPELLYAQKVLNSAIDKLNMEKPEQQMSRIEDPLKLLDTDSEFIMYFRNLHKLSGFNIALKDEHFEFEAKKAFMKYCMQSRMLRNFVVDCINDKSVDHYINIDKNEELKELIQFGKIFFTNLEELKKLEDSTEYSKIAEKFSKFTIKLKDFSEVGELLKYFDEAVNKIQKEFSDVDKSKFDEIRAILSSCVQAQQSLKSVKFNEATQNLIEKLRVQLGGGFEVQLEPIDQQLMTQAEYTDDLVLPPLDKPNRRRAR